MSDAAFLFHVLEDGKWHGHAEILKRSMEERGCGLTINSRAAELRKRGCNIECDIRRNGHGRALSYYRLVALDEPTACDRGEAAVVGSSSVPARAGAELSTVHPPPVGTPGTLPLFDAPNRGAYGGDAA